MTLLAPEHFAHLVVHHVSIVLEWCRKMLVYIKSIVVMSICVCGCCSAHPDALKVGIWEQLQSLYSSHAESSVQPGKQAPPQHTQSGAIITWLALLKVFNHRNVILMVFFPQNANLLSSRDAPHSSSLSDMALSPLSPFSPLSPADDVFWDSAETPPKVSIICSCGPQKIKTRRVTEAAGFTTTTNEAETEHMWDLFCWLPSEEEAVVVLVIRASRQHGRMCGKPLVLSYRAQEVVHTAGRCVA